MTDPRVYAAANPAEARRVLPVPPRAGNRLLWFAVFAPPLAWSVDALTSIALHHDYCAALLGRTFRPWSGVGVLLTVVGLAMLALSLAGGFVGWRAHIEVGSDTGRGDTDLDRRRFMARAALLACALFSYGIVLRLIAPFIVSPNFCGS
jgi:hypothetical protein